MPLSRTADISLGLSFVTLFGISAAMGYTRIADCKEALDQAAPYAPSAPRPQRVRVTAPPSRPPAGEAAPADASAGEGRSEGAPPTAPAAPNVPQVFPGD
jgi:hypothetical protein